MLYKYTLHGSIFDNLEQSREFLQIVDQAKLEISNFRKDPYIVDILSIIETNQDIEEIEDCAKKIKENFKTVVILGTGGSSLNGLMFTHLSYFTSTKVKLIFIENIDPHHSSTIFNNLILKETAFLCISKSGETLETLSQLLVAVNLYQEAGEKLYSIGKHFFVITDNSDNTIRNIAQKVNATILNHPVTGGRFSALTKVGLLPAAIIGLNIKEFLSGAVYTIKNKLALEQSNELAKGAAIHLYLAKLNHNINIMKSYSDRLSSFATWYRQLWAETIGKEGKGTTPVKSMGTLDHHGQLQLYLAGPQDKVFTLITINTKGQGDKVNGELVKNGSATYLADKTIGDFMYASQSATLSSLVKHNRPVRTIELTTLNEQVLGAIITHFMFETILVAKLYNVNPFNQPLVQEGKILAHDLITEMI